MLKANRRGWNCPEEGKERSESAKGDMEGGRGGRRDIGWCGREEEGRHRMERAPAPSDELHCRRWLRVRLLAWLVPPPPLPHLQPSNPPATKDMDGASLPSGHACFVDGIGFSFSCLHMSNTASESASCRYLSSDPISEAPGSVQGRGRATASQEHWLCEQCACGPVNSNQDTSPPDPAKM